MHLRKLWSVSMNQLYILLLTLWSAFNSTTAWEADEHTSPDPLQIHPETDDVWDYDVGDLFEDWQITSSGDNSEDKNWGVPEPSITVYRQMEDREHVFVLCKSATMSRRTYSWQWQSFELSVESELNYTTEILPHYSVGSSEMFAYMVTVSPPASFTCVLEIGFYPDVRNLSSQTYNYSVSVSDPREEGVSSLYICFSSFIAVGLFFMIAAVIVTNIRSKTKDTDFTSVTNNDYVEA